MQYVPCPYCHKTAALCLVQVWPAARDAGTQSLDMCSSPAVCVCWRARRSPLATGSPPPPRRPPGRWGAAHAGVQAQLATAGPTRSGRGSRAAVRPAVRTETEAGSLHQLSKAQQVQLLPTLGAEPCLDRACRPAHLQHRGRESHGRLQLRVQVCWQQVWSGAKQLQRAAGAGSSE